MPYHQDPVVRQHKTSAAESDWKHCGQTYIVYSENERAATVKNFTLTMLE